MHSNHQEDMCGLNIVWLCYKKLKKKASNMQRVYKIKVVKIWGACQKISNRNPV